jgi:hypothetical protein
MSAPDIIYAKQYGSNVALLAQQQGSRLRNTVTVKSGVVGEETYMDQIESFEMLTRTARLAATDPTLASYARRRIAMEDFYVAKAIDKMDDLRTLADPTSAISKSGINAAGRKLDDLVIAALRGTAYTGKVGGTSTTLPSVQKVAASTTGLTIAKWLAALEILNANDVDPSEEKYLLIGSAQLTDLLQTTQITSSDYAAVKALVQGQIDTFLGCKVIRTERLAKVSTTRYCMLYCKSGMGLAIGRDIVSRIDELPTNHYAKQLYFSMAMGASRLEEDKVVEIGCIE